jgi:preprotein translocase subunit YajC
MNPADILTLALEKGLFAALFVFAFWFILTENKKREESQRDLYISLSESLDKAKDAITSIEGKVERIDNTQSSISQDLLEVKFLVNSMESIVKSQMNNKNNSG